MNDSNEKENTGIVVESMSNALYRVELDDGRSVRAHIGSDLKRYAIRILPGDRVTVALSPYDTSRGKITERRPA